MVISIESDSDKFESFLSQLEVEAKKNPGGDSSRMFVKMGATLALHLIDDVGISNPVDLKILNKIIEWSESTSDLSKDVQRAAKSRETDLLAQREEESELEKAIRYTRLLITNTIKAAYYLSEKGQIREKEDAAGSLYIDILNSAPAALIHLEIASGSQVNTYELRTRFAPIIYEIAQAVLEDA